MAVKKERQVDIDKNWNVLKRITPLAPHSFTLLYDWMGEKSSVRQPAIARRTSDAMVGESWMVEVPIELGIRLRKIVAERKRSGKDVPGWLSDVTNRFANQAEPGSEFCSANVVGRLIAVTRNPARDRMDFSRSAYTMFYVVTEDGATKKLDKIDANDWLEGRPEQLEREDDDDEQDDDAVGRHQPIDWLQPHLVNSPNVILEGVPGTGKTHAIAGLRISLSGQLALFNEARRLEFDSSQICFMTMHPSTSYEDFVEGLRPAGGTPNSSSSRSVYGADHENWFFKPFAAPKSGFAVKNGFFVEACVAAVADPNTAVVVVLDELNRCNIPKVLGDLMTVIEESKRAHWNGTAWVVNSDAKAVTLPYSGRKLFVPDNLFIVGTMNTTDRSVAPMDAALRRRFAFHRVWPQGFGPDAATTGPDLEKRLSDAPAIKSSLELWQAINRLLLAKYGADAMLGHSYLDDLRDALSRKGVIAAEVVAYHWNHRILPQLMDVIASNGLTRSLVEDPKAFFGTSDKILDRIEVAVAGSGALRTAMLRLKEPKTLVKGRQNVGDQSKAPVPEDNANGNE